MSYLHSHRRAVVLVILTVLASPLAGQQPDEQVRTTFRNATEAMQQGQWDEAAAGFTSVLKASPGFAEAYFNLGLVRLQQGRLDDAVATLGRAVAWSPKLRGANLFLGIAQYRQESLRRSDCRTQARNR